jgi:REP element-mobilizing transposase RayT
MPWGLKRYYEGGDFHFITCSCYRRRPMLDTPERRNLFLTVLEEVRIRYRCVVLGYVVMPEHFHLLVSEPQCGTPSTVMQALKLGFARRVLSKLPRGDATGKPSPQPSGRLVFTISTCGPNTNVLRSCATCIEIR